MSATGTEPAAGDVLADLEARGLVHLATDRGLLAARLAEGPITAYYGCDPTAPSLHVGNLIGLLILRRLQQAGHRPVALVGGATGLVGDPSGRSEERNLLDEATLAGNVAAIRAQVGRIVDPDGSGAARLVDNRDWTEDLSFLDFLRDVGKHVTVNQMLARDSVRARLESEHGISFTEFTYMLVQARDYLVLHDTFDVELQIGGSDQWGNIVSGVDLVRRVRGRPVHALCWPLLTAADGTKVGKTAGAGVWLDPALTSPYRFYQSWIQIADDDLRRRLAWFTLLPLVEIDTVMAAHARCPADRSGQRRLAREVTALVHGTDAADAAAEASAVLFGAEPAQVSAAGLAVVADEVPTVSATLDGAGTPLVDVLVDTGLCTSRSQARQAVAQGGAYVNGERAANGRVLRVADLLHGDIALLRRGKKAYAAVRRATDSAPAGPTA